MELVDHIVGLMFLAALFLTLFTILLWFAFRKRLYFMVQLKTTEGTVTVYKTRDGDRAQQVLKAVELAIEDSAPPPLPTPG